MLHLIDYLDQDGLNFEILEIFEIQAVYSRLLPMLIMGLLATAGALCSVFLPETLGVSLPQTLEEGEAFGQQTRIWSCPSRKPQQNHKK